MSLLWNRQTGVVRRESCMFAGTDHARLLFPAAELLRISCPALGTEYLPGRDCTLSEDGRTLKLLPDSRIPRLTARELHPEEPEARFFPAPDADAIRGGVDGRNLRFDNRSFFARTIHYGFDGTPLLTLTPERYLLPELRTVTAKVTVR